MNVFINDHYTIMGQQSRDICIRFSSYVVQALLLATSPRTGASFHGTTMECLIAHVYLNSQLLICSSPPLIVLSSFSLV